MAIAPSALGPQITNLESHRVIRFRFDISRLGLPIRWERVPKTSARFYRRTFLTYFNLSGYVFVSCELFLDLLGFVHSADSLCASSTNSSQLFPSAKTECAYILIRLVSSLA